LGCCSRFYVTGWMLFLSPKQQQQTTEATYMLLYTLKAVTHIK